MAKRCPPGVICIENMTMIMITIAIIGFLYYSQRLNTISHSGSDSSVLKGHSREIKYMPVNVKTQQNHQETYRQIGILSRTTNQDVIMPLFGRNLNAGRDKWQYYTVTEHNVRLPINVAGKSCTNEYGCDSVGNGDMVYVEGYNDAFKATLYDDCNQMRYIPYL